MTAATALLALPVALPLLAAGVSLLLSPLPNAQRWVSVTVLAAVLADAAALLVRVDRLGVHAIQVGGWRPPLGITLVADRLSALMLTVSALVCLLVMLYAIGQGRAERRVENVPSVFHPTYLVLMAGIALVFLTGDLFTLFVGFEVMLMASYVLITLGATDERVRSGMTYIISSLTASLLLLTTIGLVYSVTGTVNLAQLSTATETLPGGLRQLLALMLLLALGVKAAMVPLHWWLPDSYPTAPAPVTAVFAALLTKVAVYAVVRTQTLLFHQPEPWTLLLVLAAATMLVGVLGALTQDDVNRVLSFALVSHIGFMLFGLAVSSVAGLVGVVVYLVHHITVQTSLFLVTGMVERERGTVSLRRLGGMAATAPLLAGLFLVSAFSLGGIPPLAGFVGKLALLRAAVDQATPPVLAVAAVLLAASLLTLAVVTRVWLLAFWRDPPGRRGEHSGAGTEGGAPRSSVGLMRGAATASVAVGLAVAAAAGPLSAFAQRAAEDLADRSAYRNTVLSEEVR